MKKIFIVVPEALLIRNILRSGVLDSLKKKGRQVVVFILCDAIPDYIRAEFADANVELVAVPDAAVPMGPVHRRFILFTHFLNLNDTTRVYFNYSRHYINRARWARAMYLAFLNICGRLPGLKPLVRWVEQVFFTEKNKTIAGYFEAYRPDLVFSTSITAKLDNVFLKEARRRGVPTISMTKSWDNATKMYFRCVPDHFIVQDEIIRSELARLQQFPPERIYVVGFPQFDWYRRPGVIKPREEHLRGKGLDPDRAVIFFGSQGIWFKQDYQVAEQIYQWIKRDELAKPCQLIVRPHFSNVKNTPLQKLKGLEHVSYDDSYHISDVFVDNWDPTAAENTDFANTLRHSDVVVNILSTIALDAACFDRPTINALYGGVYQNGRDVTHKIAEVVHY